MDTFKEDFEFRRNIFGLSSIIKTPENYLPLLVKEKLPMVMNQLTIICQKMHTKRLETLKENEEFVQKGGLSDSESESWGDEDDDED